MKTIGASYRKPLAFLQAIFVYMWLANLSGTDSWFSVYLLCALGGLACLCGNYRRNAEITRGQAVWLAVFAAGFSLAVILANYPLFEPVTALLSLPLRYMHSPSEVCSLQDIENSIELLARFLCTIDEKTVLDPFA